MNNVIFCKNYQPGFNEKYFIDTNVWLYLFYPQFDNVPKIIIDQYSHLFSKICSKKNLVITHPQMYSELINNWLKTEYKNYNNKNNTKSPIGFKDYKKTMECAKALKNVKNVIVQMSKFSSILSGTFTSEELSKIVLNCDKADFNDLCFVEFAEQQNATIITHDFDFNAVSTQSLKIITANKKYLPS